MHIHAHVRNGTEIAQLRAKLHHVVRFEQLDDEQRAYLAQHFRRVIFPALTPLAVAPGRPFPYISNLSLSLGVLVRIVLPLSLPGIATTAL